MNAKIYGRSIHLKAEKSGGSQIQPKNLIRVYIVTHKKCLFSLSFVKYMISIA